MKNKLVITAMAFTLFAACKKNDEKSKTQQLTSGKWYFKKIEDHQLLPGTKQYDITRYFDTCIKDDFYEFKGDGGFVLDEGGLKCNPAGSQSVSGKWKLADGDAKLIFCDIDATPIDTLSIEINGNSLVLSSDYYEIVEGVSYKGSFKYTYSH